MARAKTWVLATLVAGALAPLAAPSARGDEPPAATPPAPAPTVAPVAPVAPAPPRVLTLDAAVKEGLLDVKGAKPGGYREVDLVLASQAKDTILVDLAGRHLRPTNGDVQRLGLAHPVTPVTPTEGAAPGTFPVALQPGETKTIRMNCCCMDAGKSCPRGDSRYALASAPTPPAVETALRWWVDHPKVEQGFVNAAIWQNDPAMLTARPAPERDLEAVPFPKGKHVKSFGGIAYLLDDGALTSMDREGVRRFHATGVWSIWPGADGLLAIGMGSTGDELWRFGETGDPPWIRIASLGTERAANVVPGLDGAYLLQRGAPGRRLDGRVDLVLGRDQALTSIEIPGLDDTSALTLEVDGRSKGKALAMVWLKGTPRPGSVSNENRVASGAKLALYDVDRKTGAVEHRKTFWNIRDLRAGPAGTFGVSPGERVVRLEGERFVDLPFEEKVLRVMGVGAERVLVVTADRNVLSLDAKTGRALPLPEGLFNVAGLDTAEPKISIDPKTDQVAWVDRQEAKRWTPGAAEVETIAFR